MKVKASEIRQGDTIAGINGYVNEVEESNGYLAYPSTGSGMSAAMPADTVLITWFDAEGEENYLIVNPETEIEVTR